jgi:ribosome-associated heat shock protein Hsp15
VTDETVMPDAAAPSVRLDKWLWFARFFKSRSLASRQCDTQRIRINGRVAGKAHAPVRVGDVLTFPQANRIRVVRIEALATRRGPASEAATLYEDLAPPQSAPVAEPGSESALARRPAGSGRPTKADRRALDRLTGDG